VKLFSIIFLTIFISGCAGQNSWRNEAGLDAEGYNSQGFKDGFDRQGYDYNGCNRHNFDRLGNACKEILKIKEKNFSYSQYESVQTNLVQLREDIDNLKHTVKQKEAEIAHRDGVITQASSELVKKTNESQAWEQKYTIENNNLLTTAGQLQQRNHELNQAKAELTNTEREKSQAEHDFVAKINALEQTAESHARSLTKLAEAKKKIHAVEAFINTEVEALGADARLIPVDKKHAKTSDELVERLKNLFSASNDSGPKIVPKKLNFASIDEKEEDYALLVSDSPRASSSKKENIGTARKAPHAKGDYARPVFNSPAPKSSKKRELNNSDPQ